jgi:hypothetical protein
MINAFQILFPIANHFIRYGKFLNFYIVIISYMGIGIHVPGDSHVSSHKEHWHWQPTETGGGLIDNNRYYVV